MEISKQQNHRLFSQRDEFEIDNEYLFKKQRLKIIRQ